MSRTVMTFHVETPHAVAGGVAKVRCGILGPPSALDAFRGPLRAPEGLSCVPSRLGEEVLYLSGPASRKSSEPSASRKVQINYAVT